MVEWESVCPDKKEGNQPWAKGADRRPLQELLIFLLPRLLPAIGGLSDQQQPQIVLKSFTASQNIPVLYPIRRYRENVANDAGAGSRRP
jgi:hypothetical protein